MPSFSQDENESYNGADDDDVKERNDNRNDGDEGAAVDEIRRGSRDDIGGNVIHCCHCRYYYACCLVNLAPKTVFVNLLT